MAISEFQLALIGTGVVAVIGVWSYNAWQEYRQRKVAERIFRDGHQDVLIDETAADEDETPTFLRNGVPPTQQPDRIEPRIDIDARIEPSFGPIAGPSEEIVEQAVEHPGSAHGDHDRFASQESLAAVESPGEELLDPMIEVAMPLPPDQRAAVLLAAWGEANKVGFSKRVRWVARNVANGEWAELNGAVSTDLTHTHVAIQLADRQGVIDFDELKMFCHTAEAVAMQHGGAGGLPAFDEIMAHARTIDDLCASVDIQIAIHIVGRTGQAFAGTKLRGMLEAAGLQLAADGLFYLVDGDGKRLLSVCNSGAVPFDIEQMRSGTTADITFWLDVPRVADGGNVFDTMVATARQLAEALDGVLVDDQRNPLADNVLSGIRAKVVELQTQMAAHGIPAGGRRALRLFV